MAKVCLKIQAMARGMRARKEAAKLRAYAFNVLDALEFQHGPSHMEVKLCPNPGK